MSKILPAVATATVIGVGSSHGDDCAGWTVVDRLRTHPALRGKGHFYKASVPHDALDWFESSSPTHLVDAIISNVELPLRLNIVRRSSGELRASICDANGAERDYEIPNLHSRSTHQLDLLSVLQLAEALGRLPQELVLWAIPIRATQGTVMHISAGNHFQAEKACEQCVLQIVQELTGA